MNIRLGWSGDIHGTWTKMDVEIDESDWALHFEEWDVKNLSDISPTPLEKFKLMYSMAEVFVQLHKMSRFPEFFGTESHKKQLAELIETRNDLTKKIIAASKDKPPF